MHYIPNLGGKISPENKWTITNEPFIKLTMSYSISIQVVADSNFKYVLEIKDVPKFKDART